MKRFGFFALVVSIGLAVSAATPRAAGAFDPDNPYGRPHEDDGHFWYAYGYGERVLTGPVVGNGGELTLESPAKQRVKLKIPDASLSAHVARLASATPDAGPRLTLAGTMERDTLTVNELVDAGEPGSTSAMQWWKITDAAYRLKRCADFMDNQRSGSKSFVEEKAILAVQDVREQASTPRIKAAARGVEREFKALFDMFR